MALLDAQNLFSDSQNLAQAAGNYLSTNTLDLGAYGTDALGNPADHDLGQSEVGIFARVVQAFATGTSVKVQLVSADDAALSTNLTIIQETDAIPTASLVLGYKFTLSEVPSPMKQRYLGMRYVLAGASAFTAGKISSGIVITPQAV